MVWNTFFHVCPFDRGGGVLSHLGNGHIDPTHFKRGCPKPGHGLVTVVIIVFEVPERKNHGTLSSLVVKG